MSRQENKGKQYLRGSERQASRSYSPAVIATGGKTVYLAGHGGYQDESGKTYPGDFDAQAPWMVERSDTHRPRSGLFFWRITKRSKTPPLRSEHPARSISRQQVESLPADAYKHKRTFRQNGATFANCLFDVQEQIRASAGLKQNESW